MTTYEILLHRVLSDYTQNSGKSQLIHLANTAAESVFGTYEEEISRIVRKTDNSVTSMQLDIYKLNKIKSELNSEIYRLASEKKNITMSIPLGSLMGTNFTNGYGPIIDFKIKFVPTVNSELVSRFESCGINQTLHEIRLIVHIDGYALLSLNKVSFSAKTSYIVSQTVINGSVPDSYTSVNEEDSEKIIEDIFDFAG